MSLTEMRKNSGSLITYLMFSMIIVVFIFTFNTVGPDQACGGSAGPGGPVRDLGEVDGTTIDTNMLGMVSAITATPPQPRSTARTRFNDDLLYRTSRFVSSPLVGRFAPASAQVALYNLYPQGQIDFGVDAFDYTPIKVEKAMFHLQETLLVAAEAAKLGLQASDAELAERIFSEDYFDPATGEFDAKRWENWIRFSLRTTPPRFENFLRKELLREKMVALVVGGVTVTDPELTFYHRAMNEKVNLEYIDVTEEAAAALVPVDEAALTTWLAANQDAVKKYYDEHPAEFNKDERVIFRGIKITAPSKAVIERVEKAEDKKKLEDERTAARAKADQALADLKAKAAAGPDAKAEEVKPAEAKPAEAAAKPAEAKPAEAAEAKPAEAKPEPVAGFIPVKVFGEVAEAQSDDANTKYKGGLYDKPRTRKDLEPRYPFGKPLADALFSMQPGQVSEVIEVDSAFYIVRLDSKLAKEEKTLDQARTGIAAKLYKQEQVATFRAKLADEVAAEAAKDATKDLEQVAEAINKKYGVEDGGLAVAETGLFGRISSALGGTMAQTGQVPGLGELNALWKAAFATTKDKPLIAGVHKDEAGKHLVVARLVGREDAGELKADDLAAEREALLKQKQRLTYRAWLQDLIAKARADGRLSETSAWAEMVAAARQSWAELSGEVATAADGAAPKESAAPAPQ